MKPREEYLDGHSYHDFRLLPMTMFWFENTLNAKGRLESSNTQRHSLP